MQLWRIATDTPDYTADELSGKGAELTGGRWNERGVPMLYASTSRALACLETVVHLSGDDALPLNRYLVQLTVPPPVWARRSEFEPSEHVGWDACPAGKVSLRWGTTWARARGSLIAEVPSVVVPEETNVLINPLHADVNRLVSIKIRKWTYDVRLGIRADR